MGLSIGALEVYSPVSAIPNGGDLKKPFKKPLSPASNREITLKTILRAPAKWLESGAKQIENLKTTISLASPAISLLRTETPENLKLPKRKNILRCRYRKSFRSVLRRR
ncbi:MAG: hypothetical protein WA347_02690 [Rhabdochlamydiaceae bacterium]